MARPLNQTRFIISLLLAFLLASHPGSAEAVGDVNLPALGEFIESVQNGDAVVLRGIYIPDVLASPIVSQPEDDPGFVSAEENTLTEFALASHAGSTGLLAHNYLAGEDFFKVKDRQVFYLIYGDGRTETFIVTQVLRFQALDPNSVWSRFLDLRHGTLYSASELFSKIYGQPGRVILQTCVRRGGESSWGRLFIIAEPYPEQDTGTALER